jgi:hypothetical protein
MSHPRRKSPAGSRTVRVSSVPLEQIDEAKLALALSMMARRLLAEQVQSQDLNASNRPATPAEVSEDAA